MLFGIETEYGLAVEGSSPHSQIEDAAEFIAAFPGRTFHGWDYAYESPRADLRGFEAKSLAADPVDAQFDEGRRERNERALRADRVLLNGARLYNDHGHPEYATPECSRLLDLVAHDLAGERILLETAAAFERKIGRRVKLFKNNTDFHGASYGTHENYLVSREIPFESLVRGLVPLFVARQLLTGAGKAGSESGRPIRFQLSQRADFFSELASVDTLYRRPIFNTRDEPHADPEKWVRLHVICGDANRMQWANAMKVGMVNIALRLLELGQFPEWNLCSPIRALESISKDDKREWLLELSDGGWTTAIDVLDSYCEAGESLLLGQSAESDWVLSQWRLAIADLQSDPMRLANRCDWPAKLSMLEQFAEAEGKWKPTTMQSFDLQYHLLDPEESLFAALDDAVSLVDEAQIEHAMSIAPPTRASLRGEMVRERLGELKTLGWRRAVLMDGSSVEFPPETQ